MNSNSPWAFVLTAAFPSIAALVGILASNGRFNDLSKRIDDMSGRIEGVNSSLSKRIDDMSGRIEGVNSSLSKRIDDLSGSLSGRINDMYNNLSKRIDDVSGILSKRMDDLSANMVQHAQPNPLRHPDVDWLRARTR